MLRWLLPRLGLLLPLVSACAGAASPELTYRLEFGMELVPEAGEIPAYIELKQPASLLFEVRLRAPQQRYRDFSADGELVRDGDQVIWRPPAAGGRLRYLTPIDHRRSNGAYDARLTADWAILRVDDVFPPAAISQEDGATSASRLRIDHPADWTVTTAFEPDGTDAWSVVNINRSFDRPTGWIAAGRLGIRRDQIAGLQVAVAAPPGEGAQRVAMLALLRWSLPTLTGMIPDPGLKRLNIVSAGNPMWRGGLSGPGSIFIHADLPLLSEDGTSTLIHELIHVMLPVNAAADHDWIDEGLAEYLTLVVLRDSGSISASRYRSAIRRFRARGDRLDNMATEHAAGAVTARAVAIFHDLDRELKKATDGKAGMQQLAGLLAAETAPVDIVRLRQLATELAPGAKLKALAPSRVPGL